MAVKADYIGAKPKIEVNVDFLHNGKVNFATLKISELEIEIDKETYEELFEKMDAAMWDETKEDLEAKVEDLEAKIYELEEKLEDSEAAASYDNYYDTKQSWFV